MSQLETEQRSTFGGVLDILEALGLDYMIRGGVAAVVYGEPRFTHDMDLVLKLDRYRARLMAKALEEDHYYVSLDSILDAMAHNGFFNVIHVYTNIKVDFWVPGYDPIIEWAFEHRRIMPFDKARQAAYMPPESVILTKLRAYRASESTRHLEDVESILRVSGPDLDRVYVERQAQDGDAQDLASVGRQSQGRFGRSRVTGRIYTIPVTLVHNSSTFGWYPAGDNQMKGRFKWKSICEARDCGSDWGCWAFCSCASWSLGPGP